MSLVFYFWNRYFLSFVNGVEKLNVFNILVIQTFQTCSELKLGAKKKINSSNFVSTNHKALKIQFSFTFYKLHTP